MRLWARSAARRSPASPRRRSRGDDATYSALEADIGAITDERNEIAGKMIGLLEAAAFGGQRIDKKEAEHLIEEANDLLALVP